MAKYDVLIVGAGLFGCVIAHEAVSTGKRVLVLDRRDHIAGNCYTERIEGINVHRYGAHIFRTDDRDVWNYFSKFCEMNNFINSPVANYHGELYNLPFNMNTFSELWGVKTPAEAKQMIEQQRVPCSNPQNLEEHILNIAGRVIYEKLVQGYTEKQWGKPCNQLPATIMRRIPLRFRYDNNYFNARYQGIPMGGYTAAFEKILEGAEVRLSIDYLENRNSLRNLADKVVFTGAIDEYFEFRYGALEWRSLRFETKVLDMENYQGVAVMNYTGAEVPYTRTIEHKHFEFGNQQKTVVTWEYPANWQVGDEPYYPVEDKKNFELFRKYRLLADKEPNVFFGGRLGEYRYYDMQDTIKSALNYAKSWLR